MSAKQKTYIAIDLKSFYASVEAAERGYDPLDVNLVVADESRTDKTICLAVSPALKAHGISGRARLFEAKEGIRAVNAERAKKAPGGKFSGSSVFASELAADPSLKLDMVVAVPRMKYYMEYSRSIVELYLKYVSPDDLLVYSVDEVFIDATNYLGLYGLSAHDFAMKLIREVLSKTRITATAGIGTNLYLAKIAMDIEAKHIPADQDGVRIAELDEMSYREKLWCHRPLTDFWRVGRGTARKLEEIGLYTMGDVARCSVGRDSDYYNEDLLYQLFGVNAELLIDHAWGFEPAEIADCKAYKPESQSLSAGQVLGQPYPFEKGRIIIQEMADGLSLELAAKGLCTDQVVVDVNYDTENLTDPVRAKAYRGPVVNDWYGRKAPKPAHGSQNLERPTHSTRQITEAACDIYDRTVDKNLLVRRFNVAVMHLVSEEEARKMQESQTEQLDLFTDYEAEDKRRQAEEAGLEKERKVQQALLDIREKYGRNAVVRGLSLQDGATAIERNRQIGGHRA